MTISKEQSEQIKRQLISQIANSQQPNKEQIIDYLQELNEEELENFLKQNQIPISSSDSRESEMPSQCIFCSIVKNKIPVYKLQETKKEIAILDINPLSKAHSLVIPREHITTDKFSKSSLSLAQKIAKKIKKKLKPEDIKIETSSFQGHSFINVIPIYKEAQLKKYKATEQELNSVKTKLETRTRTKRIKENKKEDLKPKKNLPEIPPFRIPR